MIEEYVEHKNIVSKKIKKRLYQELLTAKALETNSLVVAPTGLGKTIVAVLLIAYKFDIKKNILFLAPTKPLVTQHKKSLDSLLTISEDDILLLTGQTKPEDRKKIYSQKGKVICATPQTINNDLKKGLIDINSFNIIIYDEAHRAVGDYAYVLIAKVFEENSNLKKLALTASPGSNRDKISEIKDNLFLNHIEIRTDSDLDVIDYIKDVEIEVIFCDLDKVSLEISNIIDSYIDSKINLLRKFGVIIPNNYSKKQLLIFQAKIFEKLKSSNNSLHFLSLSAISSVLKFYHAKELVQTQGVVALRNYLDKIFLESKDQKSSKATKGIVNSEEYKKIRLILLKLDFSKPLYSKEIKLIEIVSSFIKENKNSKVLIFNNYRDNASHLSNVLNTNKLIKATRFVGQANKGLSDKGLSQKEQIQIIKDFRDNKFNTLVCTSVGEEGLDIPSVDLVIFYDAVASEIRSIQRRGRTGRFNTGKVYILLNKDTIDQHYYYVSINKEKSMKKTLKNFYDYKPRLKKVLKKQKTIRDY
ncbi:MAG: helicase-related protein [Candidatus ainarchaeum sp.]|nr:helicase-related protein [Candidatus ainarchaeum sp.]MDD3976021.1 helicase-related protein [Candidatus ainarchaeum sp.]